LPRHWDGRSVEARRFKTLCGIIVADLGGDLTEADKLGVAQVALLTIAGERAADTAAGAPLDASDIANLIGEAQRALGALRAKRKAEA